LKIYQYKNLINTFEGILQLFIGLGAAVSGILMFVQPDGSLLGLPLNMLHGSPFVDFLVPGILLFSVNGLGNMLSAVLSFKQHAMAGFAGIFFGIGLVIWLYVQVSMISGGHWLQNFYFVLGIIELCCGIIIREAVNKNAAPGVI
jgi:hypothetical protein